MRSKNRYSLNSKMSLSSVQEHTFFDSNLGPNDIVIDCGGCQGAFCSEVVSRYGSLCHALEPSPGNFARIEESPRIIRHQIALSTRDGEAEFNVSDSPICGSLHALPEKSVIERIRVATTSLDSFLKAQGISHVALLKLDIEGEEVGVLETVSLDSLAMIDQITVEFHGDFIHPRGASKERMDSIVGRLKQSGFRQIMPVAPVYNDVLFVKQSTFAMSWTDLTLIRLKYERWDRVVRGAKRILN